MRSIATALGVLALLLAAVSSPSQADGTVGVRYEWADSQGSLEFIGAEGLEFEAWSSSGDLMLRGVVADSFYATPCENTGPDEAGVVLYVRLGDLTFALDRPDWEWDDL